MKTTTTCRELSRYFGPDHHAKGKGALEAVDRPRMTLGVECSVALHIAPLDALECALNTATREAPGGHQHAHLLTPIDTARPTHGPS
jgi:hypothetical protein